MDERNLLLRGRFFCDSALSSSASLTRPASPSWPGSLSLCRRQSTPSWLFARETQFTSFWYAPHSHCENALMFPLTLNVIHTSPHYSRSYLASGKNNSKNVIFRKKNCLQKKKCFLVAFFGIFYNGPCSHMQVKKEENGTIHVIKQRQLHLSCDIISLSVSTLQVIQIYSCLLFVLLVASWTLYQYKCSL